MNPSLKILHVIHSGAIGGGPAVVLALARRVPGTHTIAAPDDGPLLTDARGSGIATTTLPYTGKYGFARSLPTLYPAIEAADLVHVHGQFAAFYTAPLSRLRRHPVLYTAHFPSFVTDSNLRTAVRNRAVELVSCLAAELVVACSEAMRTEYIARQLAPPEKIVTAYNGVAETEPTRTKAEIRAELAIDADAPLLLAVGRFSDQKGFDVLLRAMPAVLREVPSTKLLLVGDGEQRPVLEQLVDRLGIAGSVIQTGFRRDVGDLMHAADAVVVPSRYEIFPLVPLEAMMAGKAVVCADLPALREAIDDDVTGLIAAVTPEAMAGAAVRLLANEGLRARLGAAAQRKARECFSSARMISAYSRIYESLMRNYA